MWLLVFAFSALPVYFFYNMDATCHTIDVLTETPASINQLCVDARQYGNAGAQGMLDLMLAVGQNILYVCYRAAALECNTRKSLWYDLVCYLQD